MTFYDLADLARVLWSRGVRWLLWSPLRLLGVVVAVAAIVVGYALIVVDPEAGGRDSLLETSTLPAGWEQWPVVEVPANDQTAPTDTADDPSDEEPAGDESGHEHTGQDAQAEPSDQERYAAAKAAYKFAAAYTDTGRSTKKWRKDVGRHAIDQLDDALASVDPDNIDLKMPGSTDVDRTVDIESLGTYGGVLAVDTDPGPLLLNVTHTGDAWVVSRVTPPSPTAG